MAFIQLSRRPVALLVILLVGLRRCLRRFSHCDTRTGADRGTNRGSGGHRGPGGHRGSGTDGSRGWSYFRARG